MIHSWAQIVAYCIVGHSWVANVILNVPMIVQSRHVIARFCMTSMQPGWHKYRTSCLPLRILVFLPDGSDEFCGCVRTHHVSHDKHGRLRLQLGRGWRSSSRGRCTTRGRDLASGPGGPGGPRERETSPWRRPRGETAWSDRETAQFRSPQV